MALECSRRIQLLNTMLRTFSGHRRLRQMFPPSVSRARHVPTVKTWVGQCARALGQETSVVGERDFGLGLEQVVMW